MTFAAPITADDLAAVLASVDALDADATLLLGCDAFAAFCDERREAWADDLDAATDH